MRPRGLLRLWVQDPDGRVVAARRATNIVLRGGAELVANRFSGKTAAPINQIGVGFGREAADPDATTLTGPPGGSTIPAAALVSAITEAAVTVDTVGDTSVVVRVASVFHPAAELPDISEAGLLADGRLYNQVVFEPVTLRTGQDVTFFWEIDFPFGH